MRVGIISTKQDYKEQKGVFKKCGVETIYIDNVSKLNNINGLVICGDNYKTIETILLKLKINKIFQNFKKGDIPIFGISSAIALLANPNNKSDFSGIMNIGVEIINKEYLEILLDIPALGKEPFKGIFKNRIYINSISPNIGILCQGSPNQIFFVRQGNYLAAAFHPELANDLRAHKYFLQMIKDNIR